MDIFIRYHSSFYCFFSWQALLHPIKKALKFVSQSSNTSEIEQLSSQTPTSTRVAANFRMLVTSGFISNILVITYLLKYKKDNGLQQPISEYEFKSRLKIVISMTYKNTNYPFCSNHFKSLGYAFSFFSNSSCSQHKTSSAAY